MVVDTSIILAIFFEEKHAQWAIEQMNQHANSLKMSTVNLTETLIRLADRQPFLSSELEKKLLDSGILFIAPNIQQAKIAATARLQYPLNLGDCFAYALAKQEKSSILTLDSDFLKLDLPIIHPKF